MTDMPTLAPDIHPEDPDDEWATPGSTGRFLRVRYLTGGLLLLAAIGGGFWGGVVAEKHHGNGNTAASGLAARFAAAAAARGGAGTGSAGGGFGGGAGAATSGQVIDVVGNTLTVSDQNGNIVKVTLGPATRMTRTSAVSASGLQIGDTVIVTGTTDSKGVVTATAVRDTAAGTGTGGGNFSGGGGAGASGFGG